MEPPPVQYVRTSDGMSIAYAVSGRSTPLVFLPGVFDHIQLAWRYPGLQPWIEGLSARFQLIQFDPRGTGMSSRGLKEDHTQREYQLDLEAVVERLKLERFILFGVVSGAFRAGEYAAENPECVAALVLGLRPLPWHPIEHRRCT